MIAAGAVVVLLAATGRSVAAAVLAATAVGLHQGQVLSPAFARRFREVRSAWAGAVAKAVGAVLLAVVYAVAFVPVAVLAQLGPRSAGPRTSAEPGRWTDRPTTGRGGAGRSFARDPRRETPGGPRAVVLRVVGAVLIFMVLDLTLGSVLAGTRILPGEQGDVLDQQTRMWNRTMAAPAIRDEPWAKEYAADLLVAGARAEPHYVPYLFTGFQEFHTTYYNQTDSERVSYEPTLDPGERPIRVGFFGGSTMAGIGQRDEHTIPSEFARLAEAAGVPVEVHNFGLSGWVSWQEFLYLERLLAHGEDLDLIVFYDGFNDLEVQRSEYNLDPTHFGAGLVQQVGLDFHEEHNTHVGFLDGVQALASAYASTSAVGNLVNHLTRDPDQPLAFELRGSTATPDEQVDAALGIYERTVARVQDLSGRYDVPVRFFWQPQQAGWSPEVLARLPATTTDISDALDGLDEPVYIDAAHTNEAGARRVAEVLWDQLGPAVEDAARRG